MNNLIKLANRIEPFVDHFLVDELSGACLKLHAPERREVVLEMVPPIGCPLSACYNLFRDGDRIRLYYRGVMTAGGDLEPDQATHYAESVDGIHFTFPSLDRSGITISDHCSALWQGIESHNLCAFRDDNPNCPAEERYKAVGGPWGKLYGLMSSDGLHWRRIQDEPLEVTGAFDSVNVAFWDPLRKCYRLFSRYFDEKGVRAIQSCESEDFLHWTTPVPHQYQPGVPLEHFYTNATVPCPEAEHILLSFPKRFVPERVKDTTGMDYPGEGVSDAVFMSSRDGVHWDRTFLEAYVRPGRDPRNWTHRSNMIAPGIIETVPGEWSMYISEHYGWSTNRLRRLTLRRHGIASLHAGYEEGECITKPLVLRGSKLLLNFATSAVGYVMVEVLTVEGQPLPSFAFDDAIPMFGDELEAEVAWKGGASLAELAGKPVRLRFKMRDADLYAVRVH